MNWWSAGRYAFVSQKSCGIIKSQLLRAIMNYVAYGDLDVDLYSVGQCKLQMVCQYLRWLSAWNAILLIWWSQCQSIISLAVNSAAVSACDKFDLVISDLFMFTPCDEKCYYWISNGGSFSCQLHWSEAMPCYIIPASQQADNHLNSGMSCDFESLQ